MVPVAAGNARRGPLASDDRTWDLALARAEEALRPAARGTVEPPVTALAVAAVAARIDPARARPLLTLVRQCLVHTVIGGEPAVRCLRALARAGEPIDPAALDDALGGAGRLPRIALAALGELAARGSRPALERLGEALCGPLRADAAALLSRICSEEAVDLLAPHLRTPGLVGLNAAAALLSAEEDPFAFQTLCEALCESSDAIGAARMLWGAAPDGARLVSAESALASWSRRGIFAAEKGRLVASAVLTAGGRRQDVEATARALASPDDDLLLVGAQAAWEIGDAQRGRSALMMLLRRGPALAAGAFSVLVRWADRGDEPSAANVRTVLSRRPVDLGRAAVYESLAATTRPCLYDHVVRALSGSSLATALEAARALARVKDPPSVAPASWL